MKPDILPGRQPQNRLEANKHQCNMLRSRKPKRRCLLVSLFMPHRLDLVFSVVELAVLGLATFLFSEITKDGELVWLEGLLLILLYGMMGGTVFLFGA